jgi:hypothetical protein
MSFSCRAPYHLKHEKHTTNFNSFTHFDGYPRSRSFRSGLDEYRIGEYEHPSPGGIGGNEHRSVCHVWFRLDRPGLLPGRANQRITLGVLCLSVS